MDTEDALYSMVATTPLETLRSRLKLPAKTLAARLWKQAEDGPGNLPCDSQEAAEAATGWSDWVDEAETVWAKLTPLERAKLDQVAELVRVDPLSQRFGGPTPKTTSSSPEAK